VASLPQQDLASPEPQHDFPSFAHSLASIPLQQSMEALASLESLPQQAIALASLPLQQAMSDWVAEADLFLSICALWSQQQQSDFAAALPGSCDVAGACEVGADCWAARGSQAASVIIRSTARIRNFMLSPQSLILKRTVGCTSHAGTAIGRTNETGDGFQRRRTELETKTAKGEASEAARTGREEGTLSGKKASARETTNFTIWDFATAGSSAGSVELPEMEQQSRLRDL
jgi:hypothetical protein